MTQKKTQKRVRGKIKINFKSKSSIVVIVVSTLVLLLVLANILPIAEKKSSAANSFQAGFNSGSTNADFSIGSNVASTDTALPSLATGYGGTNSLSYAYDGTSTLKYPTASNLPADKGSIEMKFQKSAYGDAVDQDKGSMYWPGGTAYDSSSDYIYVADTYNHRIIRTKIDGTGWQTFGHFGSSVGQFNYPRDVYYDTSSGFLYVFDACNTRLIKTKFDGSGWTVVLTGLSNWLCSSNEAAARRGLYYDSVSDYLYIADTGGQRIIKIKSDGTSQTNYSAFSGHTVSWPTAVTFDNAGGYLYWSGGWNGNTILYRTQLDGSNYSEISGFSNWLSKIVYDSVSDYLYVSDSSNNRIVKVKPDGTNWATLGGFSNPCGIHFDVTSQSLFVADSANSRIIKTQFDGTGWTAYGSYYDNMMKLLYPNATYYDTTTGYYYIADRGKNRIIKTKMDGTGWRALGSAGGGVNQFNFGGMAGLVYDSASEFIYINDVNNHRIVKTKIDGTGWATYATSCGWVNAPMGLSYNSVSDDLFYGCQNTNQLFRVKGDFLTSHEYGVGKSYATAYYDNINDWIYYAEWASNQIHRMHYDGTGEENFGSSGGGAIQFNAVTGIWVDVQTGFIYVADYGNHRIIKTNWGGSEWTTYGSSGSGSGQFQYPSNIQFDNSTGYIYTADYYNHRIVRTKMDGTGWSTTADSFSKEKILYSAQSTDDSRLVYDVASRKLRFYLAYSNKAQFVETPTLSLTDGDWYTVKASFNKAAHTLSIDLNGVNQATQTYDTDWGSLSYGTSFYIGARNGSTTDRWDGMIDDINVSIESVDTTLPTNPTAANTHIYADNTKAVSFTSDNWGNSATPYITWSGASDTDSGLKGYYAYFGTDITAEPNSTSGLLTPNDGAKYFKTHVGADGAEQNVTVPANVLTTGVIYYLILRTQDNDLNTTDKTTLFTYKYDGGAPAPPEFINASPAGCSTSLTFTFTWPKVPEEVSGLAGYEYRKGSQGAVTLVPNLNLTDETYTYETTPYQEGDNVLYLRAKDNAGNVSSWQTAIFCSTGLTYIIDGPTVEAGPSSITVNWTSSKKTNGMIEVRDGDSYREPQGHRDYKTTHRVSVSGLKSEKSYEYRVIWQDANKNDGETEWFSSQTLTTPQIINLKSEVISPTRAIISFSTNYDASNTVEYGIGTFDTKIETSGTSTSFTKDLSDIKPDSTYNVRVTATAKDGADFTAGITFSTPPIPIIGNLRFEPITDQSSAGVKITWTTNVDTTSSVFVGPSSGSLTEKSLSAPVKDHSISILDLQDNTNYSIYATGIDQYGNSAKSDTSTFKTSLDSRPPKITDLAIEATSTGSGTDAKAQIAVSFKTDESATAQVEYGEGSSSESYTSKTQEDTSYSTNHVVIIGNLDPSKIYHLRAVSRDRAGNTTNSEDNAVITKKPSESAFNLIMQSLSKAFGWLKIFN